MRIINFDNFYCGRFRIIIYPFLFIMSALVFVGGIINGTHDNMYNVIMVLSFCVAVASLTMTIHVLCFMHELTK